MKDYELRSATNGDSDAIKELLFAVLREYRLQPDPDGTDADLNDIETSYLRSGGCFDVLVDSRGVIVGSVGLYPIDSATCELRKMYLSQQVRGQGQGRRLLEHALARAKEIGFRRIVLETASVLKEATALYRRYGFQPYQAPHLSQRCDGAYVLDLVEMPEV
ncbi:MAG TPA: GNAT family N-acetyltransferase [Candidatus Sulfotelmatobacter sp.]|nr:GNAT family N-acetyltransferase [Candidatus Sulfotelmatobacter sp.]